MTRYGPGCRWPYKAAIAALVISGVMAIPVRGQTGQSGLTISPNKVQFAAEPVGSSSQPSVVTISNFGNESIELEEIIVSGIDFSSNHNCGKEVAPGAKCEVQITFKPAISGDRTGSLEIVSTAQATPFFIALSGTGE